MIAEERWKIQNKLYLMKEKKKKLERFILNTKDHHKFLKSFSLFEKRSDESILEYLKELFSLFIFNLDKILGFHYMKYKSFYLIKKAKKEIKQLTKELKQYE